MMKLNNSIESTIYSRNNGSLTVKGLGNTNHVKVTAKDAMTHNEVVLVVDLKDIKKFLKLVS